MKHEITITKHQMAEKCSEALREIYDDEPNLSKSFLKALLLSGLIIAKCFEEEKPDNETVC